jgi:hypothetical protein
MKASSPTTLAAIAVIGAIGFTAGRISSPDGGAPGGDTSATAKGGDASIGRGGSGSEGDDGTRRSLRNSREARAGRDAAKSASELSAAARKARLESIVRGENALDRNRALLEFIDQLGPGDFEDAVAHFRSMGITDSRFGEYAMLLSAWAKADPLAALDYAKANTRSGFATNTILSAWASADPQAAIRWAESQHSGDGANPYLAGIIRGVAGSDPGLATSLLTSMPRSVERGEALDALLPHLLTQGGDATRGWIDGLGDDALRNGAMMRVADRLAESDPAGTAKWLLERPNEATDRRMDDVYAVWARQDEKAAIGSLASLPAGEVRSDALRGVISNVAMRDPQAAAALMDRFPGDVDDRVVQNYVWHSFGNNPAAAVEQIGRIRNAGERDRMYGRAVGSWIERDQNAAFSWIQRNANTVSPEVAERLLRRVEETRSR